MADSSAAPHELEPSIRDQVLPRFPGLSATARISRLGTGLINRTFLIEDDDPAAGAGAPARRRYVLQRVNPMFSIAIHDNIEAVTARLHEQGVSTPRLIRTREDGLSLDLVTDGIWRLYDHVPGVSFDVIASTAQAHAAGAMVGRFHRALDDFQVPFPRLRPGVHDTARHLLHLRETVEAERHQSHRLLTTVRSLGEALAAAVAGLPPLPRMPERTCHGDLKFNNILFAAGRGAGAEQPLCLVDLDTVGPMALAFELGDAWRSWCNRSGENQAVAELDLALFRESLAGYRQGLGRELSQDERLALLLGVEWVSVELAARFAADALAESYFGWDAAHFAGRGEHNLVRAEGQWSLHQALRACRAERAASLGV